MRVSKSVKTALLAAVSLTAAAGAAPAMADDAAVQNANVAEAAVVAVASEPMVESNLFFKNKWLTAAFATGALAAFLRLRLGARLMGALDEHAPAVADAARAAGRSAKTAVSKVSKLAAGPMRLVLGLAAMALVGLVGVGFYDVEFLGGLALGASGAGVGFYGLHRTRTMATKVVRAVKDPRSD
ncbi:MAG: hypothetical protein AAF850_08175 [Pseudomonadota bacterium]